MLNLNSVQAAQILINNSVELTNEEKDIARLSREYWEAAALDHFTDLGEDYEANYKLG